MFGSSFQVGRIGGIAIEIHPSWLIILGLLSWTLSEHLFPSQYSDWSTATYWVVGIAAALLLFVTVLIHELAHAVVAIRRGLPVPKITLFIFGGVSHLLRQPKSAGEEFQIAAAGPATSLGIALVAGAITLAATGRQEQIEAIFAYLAIVNVALAVFNMLPGFPLDGGRVLRSIAWKRTGSFRRATRVSSGVGSIFGYGLIFGGLGLILAGFVLNGIWFGFIGWFLLSAARGERESMELEGILGGLTASQLMSEDFPTVTPGTSVQDVVDIHMVGQGQRAVMVALDGAVAGIVTVSDVRKLPRAEWDRTPIQRLMTAKEDIVTVAPGTPAIELLNLMSQRRLNQVPVIDAGRMVGLVTRRDLLDRVHLADQLGPAAAGHRR
jgi:Zn-dependent protease/predicted transcriptional regulator